MSETYYKALGADGRGPYSGYAWPLPTQQADGTWQPGEWTPVIEGELVACQRGYHACTLTQLLEWLDETLYELEYREPPVILSDKVVGRQARLLRRVEAWTERTARLFAADCAERVLPLYEHACPGGDRPRQAIEVARRYADGLATADELVATRAAALAAAGDAARDAARDATRDATRAAARAAAGDAARNAARNAAWAAAWAAARDAARAAAWGAAWGAERAWQTERLAWYLAGEASDEV